MPGFFASPPSWARTSELPIDHATAAGFRQMIAVIGDSGNQASIRLHASCGFRMVGVLEAVGFKLGRWVDSVLMRVVDLLLVVPGLTILIVMSNTLGRKSNAPELVAILIGLISWTALARLVRAEFLALKERAFVESANALGAGPWRIIFKHLIPNAVGTIVVNTTLTISGAILLESTLSYLGLGITPPAVSLGMLIQQGQAAAATSPWQFFYPAGLLLTIILCIFAIGDGLQSAFDPRKVR